ncbi:uncharacterized protein PHALS_12684 [Plasmopara halstedii]|uniref:RxLR-like protein n=1 Tax=Plasmopara halstedii TaxID=4781 RepID=A0A0P1AMN6_PLAHL|nr:uncharacterized protein PHALS_12684 [Plasmopara halstedii]CEG42406.1 hypothetical protein PHALS_12684 [Plasmopara halstedii]|eukprot:XP_024578775.1 hypothetical protein PHALS_12684 [Plasmopara halstedii]
MKLNVIVNFAAVVALALAQVNTVNAGYLRTFESYLTSYDASTSNSGDGERLLEEVESSEGENSESLEGDSSESLEGESSESYHNDRFLTEVDSESFLQESDNLLLDKVSESVDSSASSNGSEGSDGSEVGRLLQEVEGSNDTDDHDNGHNSTNDDDIGSDSIASDESSESGSS